MESLKKDKKQKHLLNVYLYRQNISKHLLLQ